MGYLEKASKINKNLIHLLFMKLLFMLTVMLFEYTNNHLKSCLCNDQHPNEKCARYAFQNLGVIFYETKCQHQYASELSEKNLRSIEIYEKKCYLFF